MRIPGSDKFVHSFKFSTELPKPVPAPKTMTVPLAPDRHTKHRFSKLSYRNKQNLLPTLTLGIPFSDLTMHSEKYNLKPGAQDAKLSKEDLELLSLGAGRGKKGGFG